MPVEALREKDHIGMDSKGAAVIVLPAWKEFFRSIYYALFGWKRSYTASLTFDFPNVVAQSEQATTVAVPGARSGDLVIVSATTQVNGLGVFGYVSANDVVTVVRFNYSAADIDPASDTFRVVTIQQ